MFRTLHVGLGPLGKIIVADMAKRGIGTVTAAVDVDPSFAGKTVADVVPESGFKAPIKPGIADAARGQSFDCALLTTSSDLAKCMPSLRELIALGLPIVSTCEELLYPWLRHPTLAEELDALCKRHGARLIGTGVNPGFMMDTLPVALTAVCRDVRRVKVYRVQDASTRRIPFQKKIGAGLDDAGFQARVKDGSLRHVGLGESLHFIATELGMCIEKWDESIEPVRADRDLSCGLGPIPKGKIAGVRQVAKGWARGRLNDEPVIQLEFQAAIGQADARDEVVLEADPPIRMVIPGAVHGDVATSAITLNAVAAVTDAQPGLHTMASVPLVKFTSRACVS